MGRIGTVVRITRRQTTVRLSEGADCGKLVRCAVRGRIFGGRRRSSQSAVVVGDEVEIEDFGQGSAPRRRRRRWTGAPEGRVTRVLPRRNELCRALGPPNRRAIRILAANLDCFFIVSAFHEPPYRTGFLDRALVVAFDAGVTPVFVFNKRDLAGAHDLRQLRRDVAAYRSLGLATHLTSALERRGLDSFRAAASRGRSVLFGHSGVGKTELLSALGVPGRRSGALDRRGRGRHTTTGAEIVTLPGGGEIVDTPGIRALGLDGLTPERVRAAYPELASYHELCRFAGCAHHAEPDCAVKRAVASGGIPRARYDSFIRLCAEATGLERRPSPAANEKAAFRQASSE